MAERTPKVLLVEDDAGKRAVVATWLRAAGFEIDEASTGAEGLAGIRADHDVAILDLQLPDVSGWEVFGKIKENAATSRVLVLAIASSPEGGAARLDHGADAYLVDPFEQLELLANVRALVRLRRAIEARDVEHELVLAMIGHDLRNPLSTMSLGIALLAQSPVLTEREKVWVDRLDRSCKRQERLIEQLLRLTKSLAGSGAMRREKVELVGLFKGVLRDIHVAEQRVGLETSAPSVAAIGDPVSLEQLFSNLVINGLKHGQGRVSVRLSEEPGFACVSVHSSGFIPLAARATLFRAFKDGGEATRGLGLGLFIVDRLTEAHGGALSYTSSEQDGTTFIVRLPVT